MLVGVAADVMRFVRLVWGQKDGYFSIGSILTWASTNVSCLVDVWQHRNFS